MYLLIPSYGVQVMEHYKEFAETHGQGDMAAVAATSEQWAADFDLEAVPDIPQADLPPQPPKVKTVWYIEFCTACKSTECLVAAACGKALSNNLCFAMVRKEYRYALMPGLTLRLL